MPDYRIAHNLGNDGTYHIAELTETGEIVSRLHGLQSWQAHAVQAILEAGAGPTGNVFGTDVRTPDLQAPSASPAADAGTGTVTVGRLRDFDVGSLYDAQPLAVRCWRCGVRVQFGEDGDAVLVSEVAGWCAGHVCPGLRVT